MRIYDYMSKTPKRWCKYTLRKSRALGFLPPAFCLYGAIDFFYDNKDWRYVCDRIVQSTERLFPDKLGIAQFNDDPSTTYEDLLAVLKDAKV